MMLRAYFILCLRTTNEMFVDWKTAVDSNKCLEGIKLSISLHTGASCSEILSNIITMVFANNYEVSMSKLLYCDAVKWF